ncbi:MAG TPA: alginate lyase family protein, partial [Gammaproteobacteria bacterium]
QWGHAGWVVRLSSGKPDLEIGHASMNDRGTVRAEAVTSILDRLDERLLRSKMAADEPIYISQGPTGDEDDTLLLKLKHVADEALTRGPYSVVEKTTLPPSGNPRDYWHPAPYYWPLPLHIPGLPYIRRDGRRVPGTRLYEPQSEKYDRTRLQRMFDDTFVLSLAFAKTREDTYASHAARLVRTWFLDPATAMNPNLDYAQVRVGWDRNKGRGSGIIEAKDFYFFLDAVRLLHAAGALSADERNALKTWLRAYLQWLLDSPQGQYERRQLNNHGSYYSLQVGAIAAFVGDYAVLEDMLREARLRVIQQFAPDGRQPEEMKRSATAHYCCFNLQGWINLADLAAACGHDLWSFEGPDGQSLQKAMQWLLEYRDREWPYPQADEFDRDRFLPIHHAYRKHFGELPGVRATGVLPAAEIKPLFHPHDGIRPFWQLN